MIATGHGRPLAKVARLSVLLLAVSCGGSPSPSPSDQEGSALRGGTLHVGVLGLGAPPDDPFFDAWLDPQAYDLNVTIPTNIFRCCLLRTLVAHSGLPLEEGGGELLPDLATELPEVSEDATTWTFTIRAGIRYAAPFDDAEITAPDFVRALERTLRPRPMDPSDPATPEPIGGYWATFLTVIQGAQAFVDGTASSISGVEVRDAHTLVFTLTEPTGDFADRLTIPAMAPIPPGASEGHDSGYGRFLVASGPYMVDGAESMDFSLPADQQTPPHGLGSDGSIRLVRNPSWDRATDELRIAYADRIDIVGQPPALEDGSVDARVIDALGDGEIDVVLGAPPAYFDLQTTPPAGTRFIFAEAPRLLRSSINTAFPPLDDVHVRRAVNLVINRDSVLAAMRPGQRQARHASPESLTRGLLLGYDPYGTPGDAGDPEAARAEMVDSSYDRTGDGVCDHAACRSVPAVWVPTPGAEQVAQQFMSDLELIGIHLDVIPWDDATTFMDYLSDPATFPALVIGDGWAMDFPSAAAWFTPQVSSEGINWSLVGASNQQLAEWGYETRDVPNVDERVARCEPLVGSAGAACWAEFEQYLLEEVVPWVPLAHPVDGYIAGPRMRDFGVDITMAAPAWDRIAVSDG